MTLSYHTNNKSDPYAPLPFCMVRFTNKSILQLEMNCNGILKGWWNVKSAEGLWDALARHMRPCHLCQLLESNSNQLGGCRSGDVMKNKRENKAIKGKYKMITICLGNIPVKIWIFVLFSLTGSVHWRGWTQRLIKHFTLVQSVEQKCVNFVEPFEKKLTAGDFL